MGMSAFYQNNDTPKEAEKNHLKVLT